MITKKNLPFFFLFLIVTTYKTIFTFITSHLGKNYESTKLVQFFNILNSKTKTGQNSIKYILTYQTHTHTHFPNRGNITRTSLPNCIATKCMHT